MLKVDTGDIIYRRTIERRVAASMQTAERRKLKHLKHKTNVKCNKARERHHDDGIYRQTKMKKRPEDIKVRATLWPINYYYCYMASKPARTRAACFGLSLSWSFPPRLGTLY